MTDDQLRRLVKEALERHLAAGAATQVAEPIRRSHAGHASHVRLALAAGADGDGLCLIEPAVRCSHCGYCQSYGH